MNTVFGSSYLSSEAIDYELRLPSENADLTTLGISEFGYFSGPSNNFIDGSDDLENYLILNSTHQPNKLIGAGDSTKKAKFMIKSVAHPKAIDNSEKETDKSLRDDDITEIDSRLNEVNRLLKQKRTAKPDSKCADNTINKLVKEQLKMEKNRLSAKKSREKQKRRMEDLESFNELLQKENERLLEETQKCNQILAKIQNYCSKSICESCSKSLPSEIKNYTLIDDNQSTDEMESSLFVTSQSNSSSISSARISLVVALILITFCAINSFSFNIKSKSLMVGNESANMPQERQLSEDILPKFPKYSMVIDLKSDVNESINTAYTKALE